MTAAVASNTVAVGVSTAAAAAAAAVSAVPPATVAPFAVAPVGAAAVAGPSTVAGAWVPKASSETVLPPARASPSSVASSLQRPPTLSSSGGASNPDLSQLLRPGDSLDKVHIDGHTYTLIKQADGHVKGVLGDVR